MSDTQAKSAGDKCALNKLTVRLLLPALAVICVLVTAACSGQQEAPQSTIEAFPALQTASPLASAIPTNSIASLPTSTSPKEISPTGTPPPTFASPPSPYATAPIPTLQTGATQETPTDFPTPVVITTPLQDLATLAQQSDLIVRARTVYEDGQTHTLVYGLQPEEWIKNPNNLITDKLSLWVLSGRDWGRPIPVILKANVAGDDTENNNAEYILFLHKARGIPVSDDALSYWLTDEYTGNSGTKFSNAGIFSIENGKIGFAGIPKYAGWTVDDFIQEIHRYAPTPVPVSTPEYSLALMAQNAPVIAEVQWLAATPVGVPGAVSTGVAAAAQQGMTPEPSSIKQLLQIVAVKSRIKSPVSGSYIGLDLTNSEYSHLAAGGGHYILFLTVPGFTGDECSDSMGFLGYYSLQSGLSSIFEIKDDKIVSAGIPGYEGYTVANFEQAITRLVPSPTASPTADPSQPYPTDFTGFVQRVAIVAKVELDGGQAAPSNNTQNAPSTFQVQEWLKKPPAYSGNTIQVPPQSWNACTFFLGKGPYIVFLNLDKNADPAHPERGPFNLYGPTSSVYAINNNIIQNGDYMGQPLDKLEADIRAALLQPTATPYHK